MPGGGLISGLLGSALDGLMRDIWTGTLALLRAVLGLVGELGSIDITPGGGAISNELWTTMLQLAGIIAMILFFAQLAATALNPRKNFLTAATGPVQYGVALALSIALVAGLLGAADGLASLILTQGANVTDTAAAMDQLGLVDDNNAVKATVLGILGIIGVLPLAIGYGITLIFRSASILVLVATIPITAAGLTNLATKHWFWRVSRWLLALIFLKPAFALCFALGAGVVAASGRTAGPTPLPPGAAVAPADGTGVVTLLLGLGIMFVALFAPFALFRLFAFIEPGTQPHQAMMSAVSSAMAGARSTVGGIAGADVGSVFSGATGGRFGGGAGPDGSGAGMGGPLGGGGSTGPAGGGAKEQAAAAGLAVATGGASAAAGAAGAGAGAGEAASVGAGRGLIGAGARASGDGATNDGSNSDGEGEQAGELAGAGAAASAGPGAIGGGASGGGSAGGASGGGASGGGSGGGGWSIAGAAAGAAASVGAVGGGRVGAAAAALGGAAGGIGGAAAGIGGSAPMRAAPMGGAAGSVGSGAVSDYGDGYLHRGASSSSGSSPSTGYSGSYYPPPPPVPVPSYRDESFDAPEDGPDDDGARGGVAGVL